MSYLIVHVFLPYSWLESMQQGIHQSLAFPQSAPSLCSIWAHISAGRNRRIHTNCQACGGASTTLLIRRVTAVLNLLFCNLCSRSVADHSNFRRRVRQGLYYLEFTQYRKLKILLIFTQMLTCSCLKLSHNPWKLVLTVFIIYNEHFNNCYYTNLILSHGNNISCIKIT